jgi:hypothetical protein
MTGTAARRRLWKKRKEQETETSRPDKNSSLKWGWKGLCRKSAPDWIQRLAGNTNLEARATRILETKRQREQHEHERPDRPGFFGLYPSSAPS